MSYGQGTWNTTVGTWEPDDPVAYCCRCGCEVDEEENYVYEFDDWYCDECLEEFKNELKEAEDEEAE